MNVQDNPFEPDVGVSGNTNDDDDVFIPFDTTGTIVSSFKSFVPTESEKENLPVVVLTLNQWDPKNITLSKVSRTVEENEMRTISSLTSGLIKKDREDVGTANHLYRNKKLQCFCDRMM